jgi:transposase
MKREKLQKLSSEEKTRLLNLHRKERNGKLRDKLKCILLLDKGWSYAQISEALFLDDETLRSYSEKYNQGQVEYLLKNLYTGRDSKLNKNQILSLEHHLDTTTYLTSEQIVEYVKATYGVSYTKKGMISLLHRLNYKYKKPKVVPGKPDVEQQTAFIKGYQEIKSTLKENDEILFLDGIHPVHNVRPGYGWIKRGVTKQIASNTGRKRININAALNIAKTELIYREEETIDAKSTALLLVDILNRYPKAGTIHVILDNAGYNRSKIVGLFKKHSRLNLIFLPPYCPNLNIIERLWRYFHKTVTFNRHYPAFKDFKKAALDFMSNISKYKEDLITLLTEKFYVIEPKFSKFNTA